MFGEASVDSNAVFSKTKNVMLVAVTSHVVHEIICAEIKSFSIIPCLKPNQFCDASIWLHLFIIHHKLVTNRTGTCHQREKTPRDVTQFILFSTDTHRAGTVFRFETISFFQLKIIVRMIHFSLISSNFLSYELLFE